MRPNQRTLESPYIQRNIDATLAAYGLDDVDYQTNYDAATTASAGQFDNEALTSQVRLLDPRSSPRPSSSSNSPACTTASTRA